MSSEETIDQTGGMSASRMEAFTDGVIAIIVTIMVLDLRPPEISSPGALVALWPIFLAYALSFTLVAIYWVNHHHLLHGVRRIGADTLWLNIHFLFWLSLFPFATAYIGSAHGAPFATALYAALSLAVAFAYLLLTRSLVKRNRHIDAVVTLSRRRQVKNLGAIVVMLAAIPIAYVSNTVALALLAVPALAYFIPDKSAS